MLLNASEGAATRMGIPLASFFGSVFDDDDDDDDALCCSSTLLELLFFRVLRSCFAESTSTKVVQTHLPNF